MTLTHTSQRNRKGPTGMVWIICSALVLLLVGVACTSSAASKADKKSPYLTLFAFNYTDRAIGDIAVDGRWMGSAEAYMHGGAVMGPKAPRRGEPLVLQVSWDRSSVFDLETRRYRMGTSQPGRQKAEVVVKQPYPEDPSELILHFYQDGHVEAELMERGKRRWDLRRITPPEGHP